MFKGSLSERVKRLEKKACCSKIYFYDDFESFPEKGRSNVLYVDKENKEFYIWVEDKYVDFIETDWEGIPTDESLYYDPNIPELRINVGQASETFIWNSGPQEFILVNEPTQIVYIAVNGQLLANDVSQWSIDVPNKQLTILDVLDIGDVINVNYKFLINT